jgi:hypothetical protein
MERLSYMLESFRERIEHEAAAHRGDKGQKFNKEYDILSYKVIM